MLFELYAKLQCLSEKNSNADRAKNKRWKIEIFIQYVIFGFHLEQVEKSNWKAERERLCSRYIPLNRLLFIRFSIDPPYGVHEYIYKNISTILKFCVCSCHAFFYFFLLRSTKQILCMLITHRAINLLFEKLICVYIYADILKSIFKT